MKKTICVILTFMMLFGAVSSVFAEDEPFDLSFARDNSNIYELDVDLDNDCAFVTSTLSAKDRSFTHSNESDSMYSSTEFDLLVLNYLENTRFPVFRLWIMLSTETDYEYITSATFTFEGKSYTFSDIADKEWFTKNDSGDYMQKVLIKFGLDDIEFIMALLEYEQKWLAANYDDSFTVKLVLHGAENIETTLGKQFLYDFTAIQIALSQTNGVQFINKTVSTPMKVVSAS